MRQTKTNGPNTNHDYPRDTPLCRHCGKSRHKHMLSSHYSSSPVSSFPILQLPPAMRSCNDKKSFLFSHWLNDMTYCSQQHHPLLAHICDATSAGSDVTADLRPMILRSFIIGTAQRSLWHHRGNTHPLALFMSPRISSSFYHGSNLSSHFWGKH